MSLRIEARLRNSPVKCTYVVYDHTGKERYRHSDYAVVQAYKDGWNDANLEISLDKLEKESIHETEIDENFAKLDDDYAKNEVKIVERDGVFDDYTGPDNLNYKGK